MRTWLVESLVIVLMAGVVAGCEGVGGSSSNDASSTVSGVVRLSPASPQPSATQAGLAVDYYFQDFGHVGQVVDLAARSEPLKGKPLPNLDYVVGGGRNVLDTKFQNLVGAIITGYVRFPSAGAYRLKVYSNDGARLTISGVMLHEDPEPHTDRWSPEIAVEAPEAGWYPIEVAWFERKGSWALRLAWSSGGAFEAVPAEHFAH